MQMVQSLIVVIFKAAIPICGEKEKPPSGYEGGIINKWTYVIY